MNLKFVESDYWLQISWGGLDYILIVGMVMVTVEIIQVYNDDLFVAAVEVSMEYFGLCFAFGMDSKWLKHFWGNDVLNGIICRNE